MQPTLELEVPAGAATRIISREAAQSAVLSAIVILLYITLFAICAGRPLILDNMDFPAVAEQTAATGVPIYYRGEWAPDMTGLFHPPLYVYSLAAWVRILGSGEVQVRMFGMMCALIFGVIVLAIAKALYGAPTVIKIQPLFWALYLLNPYTVQTAGLADIDTTVYGPVLTGVILAIVRMFWRNGEQLDTPLRLIDYVVPAIVLTLAMWAKLTTVWFLFPLLVFLLLPRLGLVRACVTTLVLFTASGLAFVATYALYGKLLHQNVGFTYSFTWFSITHRGTSSGSGLGARLHDFETNFGMMAPFMAAWSGALAWVALLLGTAIAVRRWITTHCRRCFYTASIFAFALGTAFIYTGKVTTFGSAPFKYVFVVWPFASVATVYTLAVLRLWMRKGKIEALANSRPYLIATGMCFAIAVLGFRFVGDAMILDPVHKACGGLVYGLAIAFAVAVLIAWLIRREAVIAADFTVAITAGLLLAIAIYQCRVDYATTYEYGQRGFEQTALYVQMTTDKNEIIGSMKDVGYKAHRRYFETFAAVYGDKPSMDALQQMVESGKIKTLIFTFGRGEDQIEINPPLYKWIKDHCTLAQTFGNYLIYHSNFEPVEELSAP